MSQMKHDVVSIETPDGSFNAALVGTCDRSQPGLVMIPEIFGINASLLDMANNFARQGFAVLALDIFWRLQPNVNLSYRPEDFKLARELHRRFDYPSGIRDMQAGINYLRRHPACTKKVGVVGYCLGGTMAYLAASRTPITGSPTIRAPMCSIRKRRAGPMNGPSSSFAGIFLNPRLSLRGPDH